MAILLQFKMEYQGWAGLIVGLIIFTGILLGTIKGVHWVWRTIIRPAWERWTDRRTLRRELTFAQFEIQWLLDHSTKALFILDENKRCIFVNDTLCRMLQIDSSDAEGKEWYKLLKESELTRVLQKWDEAYLHQSPYTNVSIIMVGRHEARFLVKAEPFIYKTKVRRFMGMLEPMLDEPVPEPKMLNR